MILTGWIYDDASSLNSSCSKIGFMLDMVTKTADELESISASLPCTETADALLRQVVSYKTIDIQYISRSRLLKAAKQSLMLPVH